MPVVSAKTTAAGLDPSVLDDPDALISLKGGGGGGGAGGSNAPSSQQQKQQPPPETTAAPSSNMVKASEHPDYAPFFKLTK